MTQPNKSKVFTLMTTRNFLPPVAAGLALLAAGCVHVKTEPIEVKPIHVTVDVNVKVDRALDDFFGDLDRKSTTLQPNKEAPKP
jgi:hypothetical protein